MLGAFSHALLGVAGSARSRPAQFFSTTQTVRPPVLQRTSSQSPTPQPAADTAAVLTATTPACQCCTPRPGRHLGSPGPRGSPYHSPQESQDLRSRTLRPSSNSRLLFQSMPRPCTHIRAWGAASAGAEPEGSPANRKHRLGGDWPCRGRDSAHGKRELTNPFFQLVDGVGLDGHYSGAGLGAFLVNPAGKETV